VDDPNRYGRELSLTRNRIAAHEEDGPGDPAMEQESDHGVREEPRP
jgi:hypothetical protein